MAVVLANGRRIEFNPDFDAAQLRRAVETLEICRLRATLLPRAPAPCFNFFGFRHPPTSTNSAAKW
jgi:hypothetical protein